MSGEREVGKRTREQRGKRGEGTERQRWENKNQKETSWKGFQINVEMINRTTQEQKMRIWREQGGVYFQVVTDVCALVCMHSFLCLSDFEAQSLARRCPSIIFLSSSAQPTPPRAALCFKGLSSGHTHAQTPSLRVPVGQGGLARKWLAHSLQE